MLEQCVRPASMLPWRLHLAMPARSNSPCSVRPFVGGGIVGRVRDDPRQIYTSVRSTGGLRAALATKARTISVAGLSILAIATIAVAVVSLA